MSDTPGSISTFFAILGILGYIIADYFGLVMMTTLMEDPVSWEQGLGQIIVSIILLIYSIGFALLATIFALIGQIWRQSRAISLVSTLTYVIFLIPIIWLTIQSADPTSITAQVMVFWGILVGVLFLHIKGLMSSS